MLRDSLTPTLLVTALALSAMLPRAQAAPEGEPSIHDGERLFVKSFTSHSATSHSARRMGDGLGPLFNHVSCAACHRQGSLGGGGDIDVNVTLLSAQLEAGARRPNEILLQLTLKDFHPAFVSEKGKIIPNILLHRFGPGERYFQLKTSLGAMEIPLEPTHVERAQLQRELFQKPTAVVESRNHIQLVRTQRNTTALFGAGLIDKIPHSALYELAAEQAKTKEISGRVPPIGPDKVGRFGWRGQQEHLHDFVLGACANELGLEVPGNHQPINPFRPKYRPDGLDLTDAQCRSLTAFVASLPTPRFEEPTDSYQRKAAARGRELFTTIGCASCHVSRIASVDGIYSDLLLHDMGPALADPVLAEASLVFVRELVHAPQGEDVLLNVATSIPPRFNPTPQPDPPTTYYGGSGFQSLAGPTPTVIEITDEQTGAVREYRVQSTQLDQEWRTPPLWGVADSAPYLHDGRAATLLDAIAWHRGEADASRKRFLELSLADRVNLVTFLKCLRVPRTDRLATRVSGDAF